MTARPLSIVAALSAADIAAAKRLCRAYAASLEFDLSFQDFEAEMAGFPGDYAAPAGALLLGRVDVDRQTPCAGRLRPSEGEVVGNDDASLGFVECFDAVRFPRLRRREPAIIAVVAHELNDTRRGRRRIRLQKSAPAFAEQLGAVLRQTLDAHPEIPDDQAARLAR